MNRQRWITGAVVAAVLVLLAGGTVVWNASRSAGPAGPAGPAGSAARQAFAFDAAYGDPDAKVLIVRYGDSSSCPSKGVRHTVVQKTDQLVVTLTREAIPPGRACTADYGARLIHISLITRLGNRTVIDGSRGKPVSFSAGGAPSG